MRVAAVSALLVCVLTMPAWCARAPFNFDAMMQLVRVDDPQLSPDGKLVAFTAQTVDLASNTKPTQIYVVPALGGLPVKITDEGSMNTRPRWAADSKRIFFVSNRPTPSSTAGISQIWSENADGTNAKPVTAVPTGADGVTVSPDSELILFTSDVYPGCEAKDAKPGAEYDAA